MTPIPALAASRWWPYIVFAIGTLAGSTGPVLLRLAQAEGMPSPVITAIRLVVASLILTPLVLRYYRHEIRHLTRRDLLVAIFTGAIFSLHFTAVFESYRFVSVLIAGVVVGSIPLWTAIIERFVLRTQFHPVVWIGLLLALAGGAVIGFSQGTPASTSVEENLLLGGALALAGAILGAIYFIAGRSLRNHMAFIPFVWLVFSSAAITSVILAVAGGFSFTGYSTEGYIWVLLATLFAQLVAHGSFNYSLAYLPATLVSMSGQMVTVISAISAFFVLQELPTPLQIAGSGIIIAGVALAIIGEAARKDTS